MLKTSVTIEIVTPLFLGGAEPRGAPELRAASFRGQLRFWWRALWGGAHPKASIQEMVKAESQVFGSTESASPVILRLTEQPTRADSWHTGQQTGVDYLFFSLKGRKEPDRLGFLAQQTFRLTLQTRVGPQGDERSFLQACAALWCLLRLGGMGARSRRGAGCLRAVSNEAWPEKIPALISNARSGKELARELSTGIIKSYQALGWAAPDKKAAIIPDWNILHPIFGPVYTLDKVWDTWQSALNDLGVAYQQFRSHHMPDYRIVKDAMTGRASRLNPVGRAAFGLPIVFYYRSLDDGQRGTLEGKAADRRASPLIFHVSKLANGKFALSFVWFRSRLLPKGSGLKLKRRGRKDVFGDTPNDSLIGDFLNSLANLAPLYESHYPSRPEK